MKQVISIALMIAVVFLAVSCRSVTTINTDPPNRTQVAAFTPEDIDKAVQTWMEDLFQFGPIATSPEPPLVGFCGINNRGMEHIDVKEFQQAFEYFGLRTQKIRFTSATNLPPEFFAQKKIQKPPYGDKETAAHLGKILGWKYSIYGELFSKVAPDARGNKIMYYEVYVYMVNIETAETLWNSRYKFTLNNKRGLVGF